MTALGIVNLPLFMAKPLDDHIDLQTRMPGTVNVGLPTLIDSGQNQILPNPAGELGRRHLR